MSQWYFDSDEDDSETLLVSRNELSASSCEIRLEVKNQLHHSAAVLPADLPPEGVLRISTIQ